MAKKLIIIGNGLGMAIDPEHFNLTNAMKRVWERDTFDTDARNVIGSLAGINSETGPQTEDDLISFQNALFFHSEFRRLLGDDALNRWFTTAAQDFPTTLRRYVFEIAYELYNYEIPTEIREKWEKFIGELIKFIVEKKPNVATLNYDDLVYEKIVNGVSFDGRNFKPSALQPRSKAPFMRDGFISGKFKPDSFEWDGDSGSYLHLHGTPLFAKKGKKHVKLDRCSIDFSDTTRRRQIVLANRQNKPAIIESSEILRGIWKQFRKCVDAADEIIVFGYSGADDHLNKILQSADDKKKWIVEWSGAVGELQESDVLDSDVQDQNRFWKSTLGNNIEILPLDSILDFTEWDDPESHIPF